MAVVFGLIVAIASRAAADIAPVDHLICASVRDTLPKTTYRVVVNGIVGCTVQMPAKMVCFPAEKDNVSPAPPGAPPGPRLLVPYACYKLKCERPLGTFRITDQFGSRAFTLKSQKLLCAPATTSPSGAFLDSEAP
jgi:hypothetical protein